MSASELPAPRRPDLAGLAATDDGPERQLQILRDRAVVATDLAFTVSDPHADDQPLVWVNPAFSRLTGYGIDDVLGRNCRFLQGPNTDRDTVARIAEALAAERPVSEVLLNYRKDGAAFWNQVSISPVRDAAGRLVNFVGVQSDVTERVLVERERQVALASAEEARNDLQLLTEATTWMTGSLDVDDAADRLAHSVVPALADYCCIDLLDEPGAGASRRAATLHRHDGQVRPVDAGGSRPAPRVGGTDPVSRVLSTGEPLLLGDAEDHPRWEVPVEAPLERLRSVLVLPLRARGQVLGTLLLGTEQPYGRRYGQRDLHLAHDLASKAALAVDNARLYAREHAAAETLQLSLLPVVPEVAGLHSATRYVVGSDGARVGGDWYDLIALPDGAVGLAVGDVVGHDLRAAAAMGQLRGVLRSYAWEGLRAGAVLDRCDQLVQGLEMAAMATAVYARLAPPVAGVREFTWSNAGHPPPLLRLPDGTVRFLDENLSPLLGAVPGVVRTEAAAQVPAESLLLFYTDGLLDLPGMDADARQARLRAQLAGAPPDVDVESLCDRVVADLMPDGAPYDDIALLAVRLES